MTSRLVTFVKRKYLHHTPACTHTPVRRGKILLQFDDVAYWMKMLNGNSDDDDATSGNSIT
jgi:hypothetical protein